MCRSGPTAGGAVPEIFVNVLIAAEDHRNPYHLGIDPIGIIRVIWIWLIHRKIQGASTIEQQFVRVITGRYERTAARKIREIILSLALVRKEGKGRIAAAYLDASYFGAGLIGLKAVCKMQGRALDGGALAWVLEAIACLKYPRPEQPTPEWERKIARRIGYIAGRMQRVMEIKTTSLFLNLPRR